MTMHAYLHETIIPSGVKQLGTETEDQLCVRFNYIFSKYSALLNADRNVNTFLALSV